MPHLSVTTNVTLTQQQQKDFCQQLTSAISQWLSKDISLIMITMQADVTITFSGDSDTPAAYIIIHSTVLQGQKRIEVSGKLCEWMQQQLHISGERIYIYFPESHPSQWGWNSMMMNERLKEFSE